MRRLGIATYNIHRAVGRDGREDPGRVAAVIGEMAPEILALQEVEAARATLHTALLSQTTGHRVVLGPTLQRGDGEYGNALLVRCRVLDVRHIDLSVPRREPRGALDVDLDVDGCPLRAVTTHFGLSIPERNAQIVRLLEALRGGPGHPLVLLGDINEWRPGAYVRRRLEQFFGRLAAVRTFPARYPVLALDGIWARPLTALRGARAHVSPLARVASDHLPVRGTIVLGEEDGECQPQGHPVA
jgi:endonuclease/exonuclease/phosphatase family metal-dependent hydrolase